MNQGKGRKKYVCGIAGILIVSLIAFYVVLNGTENNQTSQVKNEIYTLEREVYVRIVDTGNLTFVTNCLFILIALAPWVILSLINHHGIKPVNIKINLSKC